MSGVGGWVFRQGMTRTWIARRVAAWPASPLSKRLETPAAMNTLPPLSNRLGREHGPEQAPTTLTDEAGDGIDVRAILQTLWRGKGIMLLALVLGLGAAGYYAFTRVPLYTAKSQVRIVTEEQSVADLESVVSGIKAEDAALNTETVVLTSRGLLGRVVDSLELTADAEFAGKPGESVLPSPSNWTEALKNVTTEPAREKAIKELHDRLLVEIIDSTYVIEIEVETQDPWKSAVIANELADRYVESQLESKFNATRRATKWLSEQVAELEVALEEAESAVEEFAASTSLVSEEALTASAQRLKSMRERQRDVRQEKEALAERLAELRSLSALEDLSDGAALIQDPELKQLAQRIERTEAAEARSALVSGFRVRLDARIVELQTQLAALERREDSLQSGIAEGEQRNEARSGDLIQLRQLQREAEATRLLYGHFLSRMKETSAQEGVQEADGEVLAYAVPPNIPSYPAKGALIARGAVLSLVLGGALVFLLEHLNRRFRTPEELEEATRTPVMAVVPKSPGKNPLDYVVERPSSALAEAIRSLRTSVFLSNLDQTPQVIMVTSSLPGEGKSTSLLMLARITAQMGKKTLVVECDVRRPSFTASLSGKRGGGLLSALKGQRPDWEGPGLLSVLTGACPLEEAVQYDEATGLDILFSQSSEAAAADIFSSDRFAGFIKELRGRYDVILLDTPPVLLVPDARLVAQSADVVLYAVRWNSTTQDQVRSGVKLLAQAQVPVTGLLLTRVDPKGISRYGYEGYGYGSGKGYYTN